MVAKKTPFENIHQLALVKHIVLDEQREEIPEHVHPEYRDLITKAWYEIGRFKTF
jgi:hypothetical protein